MEPVVDSFPDVDRDRLDRGDVVREALDQLLRGTADLRGGVEVVVLQVDLVRLPRRHHLDDRAVHEGDPVSVLESGVNAFRAQPVAHVIARDGLQAAAIRIEHDVVLQALVLLRLQPLQGEARTVRVEGWLVAREDISRIEAFQRVRPNDDGEVREPLDEVLVVQPLLHQIPSDGEEDGRIAESRTARDPVVRLRGRRAVLRRNDDDLPAPLHHLDGEVSVRPLVLDEVLADRDVQLRLPVLVEVDVSGLQPVDEREAGGLITMPGVVRPVPTALRFLRGDAAHVHVEQREHVRGPIEAVLPDHAEETHPAAEFEGACPCALGGLHHLRLVPLLEQDPLPALARVPACDGDHPLRDVAERLVPRNPLERVGAARVELVLRARRRIEIGEPGVGPLLPARAHHRPLEPVRAVHPPRERHPVVAAARVPRHRGAVPVLVENSAVVVVLLRAQDDPVPDEGPEPAVVGTVRGTDEGEAVVIPVLVAVDLLPVARGVGGERVVDPLSGA